jgi:hypothetical protein
MSDLNAAAGRLLARLAPQATVRRGVQRARAWFGRREPAQLLATAALAALAAIMLAGPACATVLDGRPALRLGARDAGPASGRPGSVAEREASARGAPQAPLPGRTDAVAPAGGQAGAVAPAAAGSGGSAGGTSLPQPLPPLPPTERMIVKTAYLTVQVADLVEGVQRVASIVAGVPGAYVAASSTSYQADATPFAPVEAVQAQPAERGAVPPLPVRPVPVPGQSATITIKVPSDSFGDLLQRLRETGKPLAEQVSTQEVTEEYVDLEAQVRNLEATEQQYLRLLERAQRIEEILPLQQRLTEVRNQIERLRGRMNLLQRRADVSTITVTLVLPGRGPGGAPGPEPRPIRTLRTAFAHLSVWLQDVLDLLIYLVVYSLPVAPFVLAFWWWRRGRRPAATPGGVV